MEGRRGEGMEGRRDGGEEGWREEGRRDGGTEGWRGRRGPQEKEGGSLHLTACVEGRADHKQEQA